MLCNNGNTVERFYERTSRSSVTRVLDPSGNQIGDADYSGNKVSANYVRDIMIKQNGGLSLLKMPKSCEGCRALTDEQGYGLRCKLGGKFSCTPAGVPLAPCPKPRNYSELITARNL